LLERLQACHSLCVFIPYWLYRSHAQAEQWVKTEDACKIEKVFRWNSRAPMISSPKKWGNFSRNISIIWYRICWKTKLKLPSDEKFAIHGCDPQKFREFLILFSSNKLAPLYAEKWIRGNPPYIIWLNKPEILFSGDRGHVP
jgi:hypothetical protein